MKIAVVGTGYVGLTQAAGFANSGNNVIGIDHDVEKINSLRNGIVPIFEPGLENLVKTNLREGRLKFSNDMRDVNSSEVVFICVGTPPKPDGSPDLSYVQKVAEDLGDVLNNYAVIVEKSTVPVMTAGWMKTILRSRLNDFDIAVNPEFLSEGSAVRDFTKPDRIVIGAENPKAFGILIKLYQESNTAPILPVTIEEAELIKHASNAFLAMKISYANSVARLCDAVGADVSKVMKGVGMDRRIGEDFLRAGLGFGGFCFPKDLSAFIALYRQHGVDPALLESVAEINRTQVRYFTDKIYSVFGRDLSDKTMAVLGLAFKPNTDDVRLAQSIPLIEELRSQGANIRVYDPKAMDNFSKIYSPKEIYFAEDPYDAVDRSHAVIIATEWPEFENLDFDRVREDTSYVFDGRNMFDFDRMKSLGMNYYSVGRRSIE